MFVNVGKVIKAEAEAAAAMLEENRRLRQKAIDMGLLPPKSK
jgi:hypothetical protein